MFFVFSLSLYYIYIYIYMLLYVSIIPSYLPISFLCQVQTMSSNLSSLSSTSEHDNLTIVPDDSASQVGEKECHLSAKVFHSLQQRFVAHFLFLFLDVSVIWPRSQALHPGIMGRTNGHSSCFVVHCCVQVAAWPRKRQSDWWEHTGWAKSCLACSDWFFAFAERHLPLFLFISLLFVEMALASISASLSARPTLFTPHRWLVLRPRRDQREHRTRVTVKFESGQAELWLKRARWHGPLVKFSRRCCTYVYIYIYIYTYVYIYMPICTSDLYIYIYI